MTEFFAIRQRFGGDVTGKSLCRLKMSIDDMIKQLVMLPLIIHVDF